MQHEKLRDVIEQVLVERGGGQLAVAAAGAGAAEGEEGIAGTGRIEQWRQVLHEA